MADGAPILLETGPLRVRVLGRTGGGARPGAAERAVLAALDDPVALVDDRPVAVDDLLRTLLRHCCDPPDGAVNGPVTVLHPSWWPRPRVARVVAAACAAARVVAVRSRADLLRRQCGVAAADAVVIEIAADLAAVSGSGMLRLLDRGDVAGIAAAAARRAGPVPTPVLSPVIIDVPDGLPGAARTADLIATALRRNRIEPLIVDAAAAADRPPPARPAARRDRRRIPAVVAVAITAAITAGIAAGVVAVPRAPTRPDHGGLRLVAGRVAVRIPADWRVRPVTGGPGTPRVEFIAPDDDRTVLHVTAADAPQATPASAAGVVRRAIGDAPPGVFTDFRADAELAGRRALSYRETRPGRVITWWVLFDGSTRIGIGCQSAPGRDDAVRAVCSTAVASAREVTGTPAPP